MREPAIPLARPLLGEAEAEAARRAVLSGWVAQGPEVAAFERTFAEAVGAPHACAVASGTAALELALRALGVGAGDEVVTVSHSFIAGANAIVARGATPVFVDIEAEGFNIDPAAIAAAVGQRTRAILAVHQMGMPCDIAPILRLARERRLAVIEDAACALGAEIEIDGRWQPIGRPLGDVACFSFHPRKVITTGEGGLATTANPALDRRIRLWRQHGMDTPARDRHEAAEVVFERYPELGLNSRMTDIQAAIGRAQLARLPAIVAERRALAARYAALLGDIAGLVLPREPARARSNWQSYCVRLPEGVQQRPVMQRLLDRGISTRRGIMCAHREAPYLARPHRPLPRSEAAQDRCLLLPLFCGMTADEQARVAAALAGACLR